MRGIKSASKFAAIATVALLSLARGADAELMVDFNDRTASSLTQSGWNAFEITNINTQTSATYGSTTVTVSDTNGVSNNPSLDDRLRTGPANGGGITLSDMLRDFVMSDNNPVGTGLNVLVEGLTPNGWYAGRIWSHDDATINLRDTQNNPLTFIADWTANGVLIADDWNSGGTTGPVNDNDKSFAFLIQADGAGAIAFQALRTPESDGSAGLINGLFLTQVPEPTTCGLVLAGAMGLVVRRRARHAIA